MWLVVVVLLLVVGWWFLCVDVRCVLRADVVRCLFLVGSQLLLLVVVWCLLLVASLQLMIVVCLLSCVVFLRDVCCLSLLFKV